MKRFLLSIVMVVIGLSAFSQSPSRMINLQPAYPLAVGEKNVNGVVLSNNGLYMYDIVLDSLPCYEIGFIDTQTVRYSEDGHGFYVKADSLHSPNVVYSYDVSEEPQGTIEFNETTGRFKYYPMPDEYKPFVMTFIATSGSKTVSEDVMFNLMPKTPSEVDAFYSKGTMPNATDYITIAETPTTMMFNNEERTTYSVSISGKDVVFDDAVQNKVWGLSGREDIYELNIYAERLIVRSALSFPGTNITVHAKELLFEDHDNVIASINTTPIPIETLTDGEGMNGADAGNITLFIKEFKGNMALRFILNGAKGQCTNRNGEPGNGGNGGKVISTVDVSRFCDFVRGCGGTKYDVAPDGTAQQGPATSYGQIGKEGSFQLATNSYAYLHPYFISPVIRHANDAFINNQTEYTLQICQEYRMLINEYLERISETEIHEGVDDGLGGQLGAPKRIAMDESETNVELEFQNDLIEINHMLYNLEQGLDYFGNPVGWVPLLSFEVMLANYNNEIDRAIPTLYMYYWLNRIDHTLQNKVRVSEFAAEKTEEEIDENQELLNSLICEIPVLQDEANEVTASIEALTEKMKRLQNQLMNQAIHNVKKRNRRKKFFGIVKAIANVIPAVAPVTTAVNVASNMLYAAEVIGDAFGQNNDYSDAYDILKSVGTGTIDFLQMSTDVQTAIQGVTLKNLGSNANLLKSTFGSISATISPLTSSISNLNNILSKSSAPNNEVQAEYNRLIASSPLWKEYKKQMDELIVKKEELMNHLNQVFSNMTNTVSELSSDVLALDAFRRDAFIDNSKRDLNAMLYLQKMEQRAKNRLLLYDYYLRKAYEYRLLKPYEDEEFNLVGMFERFERLGLVLDSVVDVNAYQALGSIFRERISDMTNKIITEYSKGNQEQTVEITIAIPKEQLDALNAGESVKLNFHEMGVFSPDEENVRIVDLAIEYMDKHVVGNVGYSGRMDLRMTHSGISQFRKNGNLYWFNHMSRSSESPHTWGVRYDAKTNRITTIQPSAASSSLLYALLNSNTDNIMLFSRPSAWSDITLTKNVQTGGGADILVDSLLITLQYDFTYRPTNIRNIDISTNEELLPYIACSAEDINGRSNGKGQLYRSYKSSSQSVTFSAVEQYETYYFVNWTDRSGRVVSDNTNLTVNRSKDQFYMANYERRIPVLSVPDTIRVGKNGGAYTVHVNNIGSGTTEMDWYVSDSLSTWVSLNGVREGVDEGTFTFAYQTNKTGKTRVDSLEIFAPETDMMSKMIYIVQDNKIATNIEEIIDSDNMVRIYPIPVRDCAHIEGEGIVSVSVYSLTGSEVVTQHFNGEQNVTVDMDGIPHGVYVFSIQTNDGLVSRKVLKM